MNSHNFSDSHQLPPGFPASHRTNPHFQHHQHHLHLQQQQQQQRDARFVTPSAAAAAAGTSDVQSSVAPAAASANASLGPSSSSDLQHHHQLHLQHQPQQQQQHSCNDLVAAKRDAPAVPTHGGFTNAFPDHRAQYHHFQQLQQHQQRPSTGHQAPVPSHHQQHLQQQQQQQVQLQILHPQQQQQQRWCPGYPAAAGGRGVNAVVGSSTTSGYGFQSPSGSSWMAELPPTDRPTTTTATSKFPDSPPDSGSEPYSPPNETRPTSEAAVFSAKANLVNAMATVMPSHLIMEPRGVNLHPGSHPGGGGGGHSNPYHPAADQHGTPLGHHPGQQPGQPPHGPGMALAFSKGPFGFYGPMEPMKLDADVAQRMAGGPPPPMGLDLHELQSPYHGGVHNAANQPPKKRKYSDSPPGTLTPGLLMNTLGVGNILPIKPEPCPPDLRYGMAPDCSEDDSFSYEYPPEAGMFADGMYQVIKWTVHQSSKWVTLFDENRQELAGLNYRVDADKGFNFSPSDDAFVCQKKNHFQITVHLNVSGHPKFVRNPDSTTIIPVDAFYLHFYGIKMESPAQTIKIEQSQSDRSKKLFNPVKIDLYADQVHKLTVGRLHFSETTSNNMRKKGKPNPDQRYFQLVVALQAHCADGDVLMVAAHASERIIVRASNPGQFENDSEVIWNKGKAPEAIFHAGRVGINTDSPDEALTVHGNIKVTGHVISPSDVRVKKDFSELDTREQLKNISQLKVYKYTFNEDYAEYAGLSDDDRIDAGVLAQEVGQVLPDAVRETGDVILPSGQTIDNFLVVNKDRIFIENVGAVKELCKVTDKLENRITEIELINKRLAKYSKTTNKGSGGGGGGGGGIGGGGGAGSVVSSGSSVCVSGDSAANSTLSRSESNASSASPPQKHCTRHRRCQDNWNNNRRHANAGSRSEQAEQTACNGRMIQIIVIVLVIIMAICLLSITILYVLDRKNMSSPVMALEQDQFQTRSSRSTTSVSMATLSWPATGQLPLLPPQCADKPDNCPVRCCGLTTESPPDDPEHPVDRTSFRPLTSTKKWVKSTKSPNDVDYDDNEIPEVALRASTVAVVPTMSDWFPAWTRTRSVTTRHHRPTHPTTQGNSIEELLKRPQANRTLSNRKNDTPKKNAIAPQVRLNRVKRDDSLASQVALVYIKQLNETVSSAYCVTTDCVLKRGGNYTYAIPVSPNFPALFVTLQFVPLATSPDVAVTMCKEAETSLCSAANDEESYMASQVSPFQWDLPVGFYTQLFFKFRLRTTTESSDICALPDSGVGTTFAEYRFLFYRQCL